MDVKLFLTINSINFHINSISSNWLYKIANSIIL